VAQSESFWGKPIKTKIGIDRLFLIFILELARKDDSKSYHLEPIQPITFENPPA
jgi:hypothetical protein